MCMFLRFMLKVFRKNLCSSHAHLNILNRTVWPPWIPLACVPEGLIDRFTGLAVSSRLSVAPTNCLWNKNVEPIIAWLAWVGREPILWSNLCQSHPRKPTILKHFPTSWCNFVKGFEKTFVRILQGWREKGWSWLCYQSIWWRFFSLQILKSPCDSPQTKFRPDQRPLNLGIGWVADRGECSLLALDLKLLGPRSPKHAFEQAPIFEWLSEKLKSR